MTSCHLAGLVCLPERSWRHIDMDVCISLLIGRESDVSTNHSPRYPAGQLSDILVANLSHILISNFKFVILGKVFGFRTCGLVGTLIIPIKNFQRGDKFNKTKLQYPPHTHTQYSLWVSQDSWAFQFSQYSQFSQCHLVQPSPSSHFKQVYLDATSPGH